MKGVQNKWRIFLGNFALVSFLVLAVFGYWAMHMNNAGLSVDFRRILPTVIASIIALTGLRTWLSLKLSGGNY